MEDTIFNSYLTGEERADAIEESRYDLIFSRANMMFEMVNMRLEQNIKEAEFKVFSEGGTYDDYQYYIEEAEAEAAQKKRGIIGSIIDAIIKLLNKIGEKLAALGKKGNDDDEIEIDEGVIKTNNALARVNDKVNGVVNALKSGNIKNAATEFFSSEGGLSKVLVAAAGVGVTTGVIVKKKRGELKKISSYAESIKTNILNVFNSVKIKFTNNENKTDDEQNNENESKDIITKLKDTVIKCVDFITEQLSKAWGGVKNVAGNVADKVTGKSWVKANKGDEGALLVVADDAENFDAKSQVKLSTVTKALPDATADGNFYVKKEKKNANEEQNNNQSSNNTDQNNNQNSDQQNGDNDSNQNTTQQNNDQSATSQNNNEAGVIAVYGDIKKVDSSYKGKNVKTVVDGTGVKKNKIGIDSSTISEINKNNPGAIKVNDKVAIVESGADDIIRDEDVNPFIEETDINNEQYDIELAELADMFNSL